MSHPRQAMIWRDPHKPGATVLMRRQEEPDTYAAILECEGHDPGSWVYTIAVPCVNFSDPWHEPKGFEIKDNVPHGVLGKAGSKSFFDTDGSYKRPIGDNQTATYPGLLLQTRSSRIVTVPEVKPGLAFWFAYRDPTSGWALDLVHGFDVYKDNWEHSEVWWRYIGDGKE